MQAYATAERMPSDELRVLENSVARPDVPDVGAGLGNRILDDVVGQLADLVAERVAARLAAPQGSTADEWLDTRRAAEYLGIHRDRLRRLAAEGAIPAEQEGTGCKLYFRRSQLDAWRRLSSASVVRMWTRRHG